MRRRRPINITTDSWKTPVFLSRSKTHNLLASSLFYFSLLFCKFRRRCSQGIISERQNLKAEATQGITANWGTQQLVVGPKLIVPYVKKIQEGDQIKPILKHGVFLPETLDINAKLDSTTRYRGIFEVPVYDGDLNITGQFERPDLKPWGCRSMIFSGIMRNSLWKSRMPTRSKIKSNWTGIKKVLSFSLGSENFRDRPPTKPHHPQSPIEKAGIQTHLYPLTANQSPASMRRSKVK